MTTAANLRRIELAAIHSKKKQLGLDDDTYRAMLETLTGKRSAADLDWRERKAVLEHMSGAGAKSPSADEWAFITRAEPARRPMLWKIKALAREGGKGKKYVDGIAKKMAAGTAQPLEFCDLGRLRDIVAALELDARRRAAKSKTPSPQPSPASGRGSL